MRAGSKKSDRQGKTKWDVEINDDLCKGCEICIEFCPLTIFGSSEKLNRAGYYVPVILRPDACNGCRFCELLCPELAIVLAKR